jgi:hypothetical protein
MVSTNPKARRNRSLTTRKQTIGGALPPEAFLAQVQDDPEEWSPLGLTCALVVRKRRGLSRHIWRAYQDQSINALVYPPQRIASSKLKVYANIKLQGATRRFEDFVKLHEGTTTPRQQKLPEKPRLFKTSIASWVRLTKNEGQQKHFVTLFKLS